MDLSDTKTVVGVDQPKEDERLRALELAIGTLVAVRRLVAAYDRVKGERDDFERQFASIKDENERLRGEAKTAKDQRDKISNALTMFTDQIDAISVRCTEVVNMARLHAKDDRNPAELPINSSRPAASRTQTYDRAQATLSKQLPTDRPPAGQPGMSSTQTGARAQTNGRAPATAAPRLTDGRGSAGQPQSIAPAVEPVSYEAFLSLLGS